MTSRRDPLLSPEQAVEYLGKELFSIRTLARWRQESRETGHLKGPTFIELDGGRIAYRQSALDRYVEKREFKAEASDFRA